jgi:DNA-binding transcriptional LysR family regulator
MFHESCDDPKQVTWSALKGHRVIIVGRTSGNRAIIDTALARCGTQLDWAYEVSHLSGSLGLVEGGLGIAMLPRLATPGAKHPIIRTLRLVDPEISRTILRRSKSVLSPPASQFLNMMLKTVVFYLASKPLLNSGAIQLSLVSSDTA